MLSLKLDTVCTKYNLKHKNAYQLCLDIFNLLLNLVCVSHRLLSMAKTVIQVEKFTVAICRKKYMAPGEEILAVPSLVWPVSQVPGSSGGTREFQKPHCHQTELSPCPEIE